MPKPPRSKKVITIGGEGSDIVAIETKKIKINASSAGADAVATAFRNLGSFDWILFTSKNAVRFFIEELVKRGIQLPPSIKIAAVGSQTAKAAESMRVKVSLIPRKFSAEHAVNALVQKIKIKGKVKTGMTMKGEIKSARILFPRSAIAPYDAIRKLRSYGTKVTVIPLYTTIPLRISRAAMTPIEKGEADYLVFTSPSGAKSFMKNVAGTKARNMVRNIPAVCIGPRTAAAVRTLKFKKIHTAETYSKAGIAGLLRNLP